MKINIILILCLVFNCIHGHFNEVENAMETEILNNPRFISLENKPSMYRVGIFVIKEGINDPGTEGKPKEIEALISVAADHISFIDKFKKVSKQMSYTE